MKNLFIVALGVASVAPAFASYEVLLVSDNSTKSVHRFDPISGAYLGNFGGGFLTGALDVAVNQTLGLAYIRENSTTVQVFNYSTGIAVNKYTLAGSDIEVASDGSLLTATSSTMISHFNAAGGFIENWSAPSGFTFGGVAQASPGYAATWLVSPSVQSISVYKFGSPTLFSSIPATGYGTTIRAVSGNANGFLSVSNDSSVGRISNWTGITSGVYANSFGYGSLSADLLTVTGAAFGHGAYAYACGISALDITKGQISRFDRTALGGFSLSTFGSAYLKNPTGMASVVAPEPTTLVVLGLGALALRRRRR